MKITPDQTKRYRDMATKWLAANLSETGCHDVKTGSDAWAIASRSGILHVAYQDRSVTDAHIQTALEAIFPNAVFKDRKRY